MRRKIVIALMIFVCFILQTTLMPSIKLGSVAPNLCIILTSSYGFMRGKKSGLLVGFFCGILTDIFFGDIIGLYALIYMYIGFLNGFFHQIFFPEDIKLPLALIMSSDFVYGIVVYALMFLLKGSFHFGYYFTRIIIPEMIYTIILTVLVYPINLKINQKFDQIEKRSEKKFV